MAGVGERAGECRERGRGVRWRRGGEIIISPPSVNKPTPHYQCMREGWGGTEGDSMHSHTHTVITLN